MSTELQDAWDTGEKAGHINIGTHKLWLSVHGPDRRIDEPLVIIIPGLGSSSTSWAAVRRGLSPFARVLQYERSGYGESDSSDEMPSALNIARQLDRLLQRANLPPPYVIVAHSWGGILSREFLALRPNDVAGMVFVDANQERTLDVLDWRSLAQSDLLFGVDYSAVTGISDTHKLTKDEWSLYQITKATEKFQRQTEMEFAEYPNSFSILASKSQLHREPPFLGRRPVCVIKGDARSDFEKLLKVAIARGNGDGAKVAAFQGVLDSWDEKDRSLQSEILSLSTRSQYIEVANSGHNVHLTEPQTIIEGVRWVLSHIPESF